MKSILEILQTKPFKLIESYAFFSAFSYEDLMFGSDTEEDDAKPKAKGNKDNKVNINKVKSIY